MNGRDSEDPRAPLSQKQDTRGHGTGGTLKRGRGRDAERANRRGIRERRPLSFFSPPPPVSRENRGSCSAPARLLLRFSHLHPRCPRSSVNHVDECSVCMAAQSPVGAQAPLACPCRFRGRAPPRRELRPAHLARAVPPLGPGTEQVCCDCHGET